MSIHIPEWLQSLNTSEWIQISQALILLMTVFIVWRYTYHTKKLKEITQNQIELQLRPFVVIEYDNINQEWSYFNIGNSPALSIKLEKLNTKNDLNLKKSIKTISYLNKNNYIEVPKLIMENKKNNITYHDIENYVVYDALSVAEVTYLTISYNNLVGQNYNTEMVFSLVQDKKFSGEFLAFSPQILKFVTSISKNFLYCNMNFTIPL